MKCTIILIIALPFSFLVFGQKSIYHPIVHLASGYESAPKSNIGAGVMIRADDALMGLASIQSTLNYEAYYFEEGRLDGVNLNYSAQMAFLRLGANLTYLIKDNGAQPLFKPEIGLTYLGLIYVTYRYTVGNVSGYFPKDYDRHGVRVGINIPILSKKSKAIGIGDIFRSSKNKPDKVL